MARKAAEAGLRPLYTTSFVVLAFPVMVAARLLERRLEKPTTQDLHIREFRISPTVNAAFRVLTRAEHRLRRLGLPMPFGGSQVLVAERPE